MSRIDNEVRITPSVLDRLLDDRPEETREAVASRQTSLRLLKDAVRRDLEWLLNTRLEADERVEELPEVSRSLAMFGLPDFTSAEVFSTEGGERLRKRVETAVRVFEPRLEHVRVALGSMSRRDRAVRFQIEAQLRVEPSPEPVVFDTMLQLGSGEARVQEK
ncbi:MAG TPA: type VI secretion system baseplate subunit TssE [Thermoanaerobaculia bacterium]|nr:type VI secretion system baseplate subunit TssE [Thermoanaerobaculia bacterium]